jgi:prepilin-type N-terminal cleavage/methylation domain-containing protein
MLQKLKIRQQDKKGFTIIEVMIVLAIAGLIMLIVFLAVPALQRTARNTQRKNDASAVAAAVANYIDDNGGTLPTGVGWDGVNKDMLVVGTLGSTYTSPNWSQNTETAKLGFYTVGSTGATLYAIGGPSGQNIFIQNVVAITTPTLVAPSTAPTGATINNLSMVIDTGETCNDANNMGGAVSARTAAIFYVTETSSGDGSLQCVEQ